MSGAFAVEIEAGTPTLPSPQALGGMSKRRFYASEA